MVNGGNSGSGGSGGSGSVNHSVEEILSKIEPLSEFWQRPAGEIIAIRDEYEYGMTISFLRKDGTLIIAGSVDFGYNHNIEIHFMETTYISCPTEFHNA